MPRIRGQLHRGDAEGWGGGGTIAQRFQGFTAEAVSGVGTPAEAGKASAPRGEDHGVMTAVGAPQTLAEQGSCTTGLCRPRTDRWGSRSRPS